jgi:hypothetical protein
MWGARGGAAYVGDVQRRKTAVVQRNDVIPCIKLQMHPFHAGTQVVVVVVDDVTALRRPWARVYEVLEWSCIVVVYLLILFCRRRNSTMLGDVKNP